MPDLKAFLNQAQTRVDKALERTLPNEKTLPARLHQAMRYATLNGGKRIRPALVYAAAEACGGELATADTPAVAVEMIHAYSLIHDDLPAMDDDDLRRGQPTCHIKFDEATAILAGDALQALAFQVLAECDMVAEKRLGMIRALSIASGSQGMVGGQVIDLSSEGKNLSLQELESLHLFKTGAVIEASVVMGALSAGVEDPGKLSGLRSFARCIGLAFQVKDDILDIEGETETLGKNQGSDIALAKATYPSLLGLAGAKEKCKQLHELAQDALATIPELNTARLTAISDYIIARDH